MIFKIGDKVRTRYKIPLFHRADENTLGSIARNSLENEKFIVIEDRYEFLFRKIMTLDELYYGYAEDQEMVPISNLELLSEID